MKTIGFKQVSLWLGVATLMLGFNGLKVQAEAVSSDTNDALTSPIPWEKAPDNTQTTNSSVRLPQSNLAANPVQVENPITNKLAATPVPGKTLTSASVLRSEDSKTVAPILAQTEGTTPGTITPGTTTPGTITPGTTTPGTITPGTTTPGTIPPGTNTPDTTTPGIITPIQTTPDTTTPGIRDVTPGRATRSGSSYFGVGGNIGLGDGDTAIGEGSFAVISKIGLTRAFSVRPSALIGDSVTILLPVTYDLSFGEGPTGELGFTAAPFVGAGAAISTSDDASVDLLLTGGVDVPLTPQLTGTASVNASVTGNGAVGVLLGIGYNFNGF
jgi:hypothetical protein